MVTSTPAPETLDGPAVTPHGRLMDGHGRPITDLRLSVTDHCNYRCVYCRTGNDGAQYAELPMRDYLRMVRVLVSLGVEKVRLTGGEPLLRRGLLELIADLAALRTPEGRPLDLALTTNGHLLESMADDLRRSGLSRITVSMDAVEPQAFARITRVPNGYDRVLAGIRAARRVWLDPVKVNCVLLRGFNDDQIEAFADFARDEQVILRFIEFMPLEEPDEAGHGRAWSPEAVVPMREIVERISRRHPLQLLPPNHISETARRYGFVDGGGEIGIIAPVTQPFCGHCSRIRITSDGKVRTCLFSQSDHDLYGELLRGATDEQLAIWLHRIIQRKEARHHIGEPGFLRPSRSMVHIGG